MKQSKTFSLVRSAVEVAKEKFGVDVLALDVRDQTSLAESFLFIGATSTVHVKALEDAIRNTLSATSATLIRTDGQRGHLWRVLDYGDLIIHIMEQKTREFYGVERLWNLKKLVPLTQKKREPRKTKHKKK